MAKKIGVIAEDSSDIEVIKQILNKILPPQSFTVKKFVGNGCGKLRNKCSSWTKILFDSGCQHVFIFHDLDRYNLKKLRTELEVKVCPREYPNSLVVIPSEELEAWLLADVHAIKTVFKLTSDIKLPNDVEKIPSPKEYIEKLVWKHGKKRYLNTVHNKKIAELIELTKLENLSSYRPFNNFIAKHFM